ALRELPPFPTRRSSDLVQRHDVKLIVPLTDLDQVVLAEARGELGTLVLLPDAEIVERLGDKYLAHVLFEERGIDSPPTWLPNGEIGRAHVRTPVTVRTR